MVFKLLKGERGQENEQIIQEILIVSAVCVKDTRL